MLVVEWCIVDFIVENVQLLCDYFLQQLVNVLGISQFSVVKFIQKLGFKGYLDFKYFIGEVIVWVVFGEIVLVLFVQGVVSEVFGDWLWWCKCVVEEEMWVINVLVMIQVVVEVIDWVGCSGCVFLFGMGDDDVYVCVFVLWLVLLGIFIVYSFDVVWMIFNVVVVQVGDVLVVIFEFGQYVVLGKIVWQFCEWCGQLVMLIWYIVNLLCMLVDIVLVVLVYDE